MTPFATAVQSALDARKAAMTDGPRTMADLVRLLRVSQPSLHQAFSGLRPLPPKTESAIRAALPELALSIAKSGDDLPPEETT